MAKENRKLQIAGICAIATIIIVFIVAIAVMKQSGIEETYFVSDGTKYVIPVNVDEIRFSNELAKPAKIYAVYYYQDNKITSMKDYYFFEQESDAKAAYDYFSKDKSSNYKTLGLNGHYLIATANESEYANKTPEEIRQYLTLTQTTEPPEYDNNESNTFDENGEQIETDASSEENDNYVFNIESNQ